MNIKKLILILSIAILGCSDDTVNKCNCRLILDDCVSGYSILVLKLTKSKHNE